MQQQISVITLAVTDLAASKRFYTEGFGWKPVFEQEGEIIFYQMNGLMLGTWKKSSLEEDMQRQLTSPGAFSIAHNVPTAEDVQPLINRLVAAGGKELRKADAPPHGGMRGYVADPDDHSWEIAHNPAWPIDAEGHVTFGV
jgi:catechol 2,3-dioxygenase-like lactoylglutathione lyase family enzyme